MNQKKIKHLYLNFSTFDLWQTCQAKLNYSSILNLEANTQKSSKGLTAAQKGTLVHKCLDAAAKLGDWEDTFEAICDEQEYALPLSELKLHQSGSKEHLRSLLKAYMHKWKWPSQDIQVLQSEVRLEAPITPWLTAVGTIDSIIRENDEMKLMDHKTSSGLYRWLIPSIDVSDQFTLYLLLARANGFMVNSMIVDGICTDKTALETENGLFARIETSRSDEQISDFRERFINIAMDIKQGIENNTFQPRMGKTCNDFGSLCHYYSICASPTKTISENVKANSFKAKLQTEDQSFKIIWED
jgi:hypothetical protein